jgi:hypothetical protein
MQTEIAKKDRNLGFMGMPSYTDERGKTVFKIKELLPVLVGDINTSNHFERRVKTMNTDIEKANESANEALAIFENSIVKVIRKQEEISNSAKKVSGNLRQSANELAEGLIKLEKSANFQNLEKYTELLERCAKSLSVLAELQKNGLLEKISIAIK